MISMIEIYRRTGLSFWLLILVMGASAGCDREPVKYKYLEPSNSEVAEKVDFGGPPLKPGERPEIPPELLEVEPESGKETDKKSTDSLPKPTRPKNDDSRRKENEAREVVNRLREPRAKKPRRGDKESIARRKEQAEIAEKKRKERVEHVARRRSEVSSRYLGVEPDSTDKRSKSASDKTSRRSPMPAPAPPVPPRPIKLPGTRATLPETPEKPAEHPAHQKGQFKSYGVNPMIETAKDALSTFGADVDTGSYTLGRRVLNEGSLPPSESVRVEEYLNYFYYDYPAPEKDAFDVHLEAAPSPFVPANNRKILRVGVQGQRVSAATRKPAHLTFLVDVSGSMWGPDRIDLVKKALKILTLNLRDQDTVAISTYASDTEILLEPTSIQNRGAIMDAIDKLYARGSTNMDSGLKLAYQLAMQSFVADEVNRVIVLTDGDANIGATSHTRILEEIQEYVDKGITLSAIGFGMGNLREVMMEQLANKGNGNYYYLDTEAEARKVFGEQLDGTLQVIAKDVKFQVEFDPQAVIAFRLIGYENRAIAHEDFANDKVDSGDIGAGHTVTALYEVVLSEAATQGEFDKFATVRVRHKKPDGKTSTERTFDFERAHLHKTLADASKDFQFAAAVAGFAEVLRESPYARELNLSLVEELARASASAEQKDRQEFIDLVQKARAIDKAAAK